MDGYQLLRWSDFTTQVNKITNMSLRRELDKKACTMQFGLDGIGKHYAILVFEVSGHKLCIRLQDLVCYVSEPVLLSRQVVKQFKQAFLAIADSALRNRGLHLAEIGYLETMLSLSSDVGVVSKLTYLLHMMLPGGTFFRSKCLQSDPELEEQLFKLACRVTKSGFLKKEADLNCTICADLQRSMLDPKEGPILRLLTDGRMVVLRTIAGDSNYRMDMCILKVKGGVHRKLSKKE